MAGKSFFIDLSRCTACRGCQVACKQWNGNPAVPTKQYGSHQNPADLSFHTYKLVRFKEVFIENKLNWLFFPDQCRHCADPPCKAVGDSYDPEAIIHDAETGAVIYTEKTKAIPGDLDPLDMCPFNIPRRDPNTGQWSKCTMCIDRVRDGRKPACVQSCPTGTMNFGDRDEMIELARERLAVVLKKKPNANLNDVDFVRCIVLMEQDPMEYYDYMVADAGKPFAPMGRRNMLARFMRPLRVG